MLLTLDNQNISLENLTPTFEQKSLPKVLTQTMAHSSRSEKYVVVQTEDVIKQLEKSGFSYVENSFREEKNRAGFKGFGTHLLCFEHLELTKILRVFGDNLSARIYLRNSYHGRTKLVLNIGMFRGACLNGLFFGTSFQSINLKHIGITKKDSDAILEMMINTYKNEVVPLLSILQDSVLDRPAQLAFAKVIMAERLKFHKGGKIVELKPENLLRVRRDEDTRNSIWIVGNRIQENLELNYRPLDLIEERASYVYEGKDKDNNVIQKERKLSRISGISNVVNMNQFLFDQMKVESQKNKQIIQLAA
jgi:hypothetical protein